MTNFSGSELASGNAPVMGGYKTFTLSSFTSIKMGANSPTQYCLRIKTYDTDGTEPGASTLNYTDYWYLYDSGSENPYMDITYTEPPAGPTVGKLCSIDIADVSKFNLIEVANIGKIYNISH